MDLTQIEDRLKAHHRAFKIFFSPESVAPYVRQLIRLTPEQIEDILTRVEYSEHFIKPHTVRDWCNEATRKPDPEQKTKAEKPLTPFDDFLNKAVAAFQCHPYNKSILQAVPLAALIALWPQADQKGIGESLQKANITDGDIDTARRVAKELIEAAEAHNKSVRQYIRAPYQP